LQRRVARRSARRCQPDAQQSDEFVVPRMARELAAPADAGATGLVCRCRAIASTRISLLKPQALPQLFLVRRVLLASRPARQVSPPQVSPQLYPVPLVLPQRLAAQQVSQARRERPPPV
jgi:hypothetical protein